MNITSIATTMRLIYLFLEGHSSTKYCLLAELIGRLLLRDAPGCIVFQLCPRGENGLLELK